jgi:phage terminase large subunit-like protein
LRTADGGLGVGNRAKVNRVRVDAPPWRSWRTKSRAARAIRFVETFCRIPSGANAGSLLKLAPYQREGLERVLADGNRIAGWQIPRGNAKSTLWAAVGLWAVSDPPDAPQVPLVAFNSIQAQRTLFRPMRAMVEASAELSDRLVLYMGSNDRRIWSPWNNGELLPLAADVERLQGLNPTVALIDETQTVSPEVYAAILQGAGKRPESLVLAIGTPAPGADASALFALREAAGSGASVAWVEFAAPAGCAVDDREAWRTANPAIGAGILHDDVLAAELAIVSEAEFRCYRLGQWVAATVASWLPQGAWDACETVPAPDEGAEVTVALAGTWGTSQAIVGATPDGAVFLAWGAETATDDELAEVVAAAMERWDVTRVVFPPQTRTRLFERLDEGGVPVEIWDHKLDATSAAEWRRAIIEGRFAHDHDPMLAAHVAATVAKSTPDGGLRLVAGDGPADACRAARLAWWSATAQTEAFAAIY